MSRRHHFHADRDGHSITVNVRCSVPREVEVLVDGKEVEHRSPRDAGTTVVSAELPDDPPHPFRVAVRQSRFGTGVPRCVLLVDGVEEPMAERAVA